MEMAVAEARTEWKQLELPSSWSIPIGYRGTRLRLDGYTVNVQKRIEVCNDGIAVWATANVALLGSADGRSFSIIETGVTGRTKYSFDQFSSLTAFSEVERAAGILVRSLLARLSVVAERLKEIDQLSAEHVDVTFRLS